MNAASDPRLTCRLDGRAARSLEGLAPADAYLDPAPHVVTVGRASLRARPDPAAEQETELLFGERFDVLLTEGPWAFGQGLRDGYVGWVEAAALRPEAAAPNCWVRALRSVALAAPSPRAPPVAFLALNALVTVETEEAGFSRLAGGGWVPSGHLAPVGLGFEADPAAVAERHLGAPYLWGGRTTAGVDCSGLVQQALFACGRACPRDSDLQASLGRPVGVEALRRGDLVCWPGHIGLMADAERLVHASGVQMAVVAEPLAAAVAARLADAGPPTGFRRL